MAQQSPETHPDTNTNTPSWIPAPGCPYANVGSFFSHIWPSRGMMISTHRSAEAKPIQGIRQASPSFIENIKNQIDEADKLKEDAKNILPEVKIGDNVNILKLNDEKFSL